MSPEIGPEMRYWDNLEGLDQTGHVPETEGSAEEQDPTTEDDENQSPHVDLFELGT